MSNANMLHRNNLLARCGAALHNGLVSSNSLKRIGFKPAKQRAFFYAFFCDAVAGDHRDAADGLAILRNKPVSRGAEFNGRQRRAPSIFPGQARSDGSTPAAAASAPRITATA
jgi:hypothetical protein